MVGNIYKARTNILLTNTVAEKLVPGSHIVDIRSSQTFLWLEAVFVIVYLYFLKQRLSPVISLKTPFPHFIMYVLVFIHMFFAFKYCRPMDKKPPRGDPYHTHVKCHFFVVTKSASCAKTLWSQFISNLFESTHFEVQVLCKGASGSNGTCTLLYRTIAIHIQLF